jgi:SET domain-containing protein
VNVHIQRNLPKRTILGHSEVQGFGLYAGEKIKAGSYLGEYKGEVITRGEAERRGAIYQHLKTNYLFSLNKGT